jgi:hypothetical protein
VLFVNEPVGRSASAWEFETGTWAVMLDIIEEEQGE